VIGGLLEPQWTLGTLKSRLQREGFSVYTMELPTLGTQDIAASASAVGAKVDQIRSETGAGKVDFVGHSEGGLASRYYLSSLGGTANVGRYVSLGTPQHGTAVANLIGMFAGCLTITACKQMRVGSDFLNSLNGAGETPGGVTYTAISTTEDELVVPYSNAFLNGNATNVTLQQFCWARVVGHGGLILDAAVEGLVAHALRDQPLATDCNAL